MLGTALVSRLSTDGERVRRREGLEALRVDLLTLKGLEVRGNLLLLKGVKDVTLKVLEVVLGDFLGVMMIWEEIVG